MRVHNMAVTHRKIVNITEGQSGATVLHLEDNSMSVQSPSWMEKNRPRVGGYLIDNGRKHGEQWFAANSLESLPAVLTEVQRVAAQPGELVLFKLPKGTPHGDGEILAKYVAQAAPDLPFVIVAGDLEVVTISASAAQAMADKPAGSPA